jgi:hypothetical protein
LALAAQAGLDKQQTVEVKLQAQLEAIQPLGRLLLWEELLVRPTELLALEGYKRILADLLLEQAQLARLELLRL